MTIMRLIYNAHRFVRRRSRRGRRLTMMMIAPYTPRSRNNNIIIYYRVRALSRNTRWRPPK